MNMTAEHENITGENQLYSSIIDYESLLDAFYNAKKGVDWKNSIQWFYYELAENIVKIHNEIESGNYHQKPFCEFDLNERGKTRHIKSVSIKDRIPQKSICDNALVGQLTKYLIYDNGASVKGKGLSFARKRMKYQLHRYWCEYKTNEGYILLIDYSKYFDSINHDKLIEMISEKIKDEKFIKTLKIFIDSFEINGDNSLSLGIGSQISQISGIFYPHKIDNYFTIVKGCKFYGRYMDDSFIISKNKEDLLDLINDVERLCDEYKIILNKKKTQIFKLSKGFKWLQIRYVLSETGKIYNFVSPKTLNREKRKLKKQYEKFLCNKIDICKINDMFKSWYGEYSKYDSKEKVYKIKKIFDNYFGNYVEIYENEKENRKNIKFKYDDLLEIFYQINYDIYF